MNDLIFRTNGSWDSTTLYNNGHEVPAAQLYIEIHTGRDYDGSPTDGGIANGTDLTALVRPQETRNHPGTSFPVV